jgi:two-component system response regulator HydG
LQERVIRKVGSEKDQAIDVRILVATNNDLLKAIEQGRFRTDIYYRINEVKIHLLPLREKKEELDEFIDYFIEKANRDLKKSVVSLSSEARNKIHQYPWPGNLRELENAIKHALLFTDSNKITAVSLPEEVLHPSPTIMEKLNGFSQHSSTSYLLKEATEKAEKEVIIKALEAVRNNKSKAAELLGIDRKTLYNKLNLYGLDNAKEV